MNKKFLKIISSFIIGGTLTLNSLPASAAEFSAYDTYKSAIENTLTSKALTTQYNMTISEFGNDILDSTYTPNINNIDNITSSILEDSENTLIIDSNSDGTKQFSANLPIYKVTSQENAAVSSFLSNIEDKNSDADIPKLVRDVYITDFTLCGHINKDNILQDQTAIINLAGIDDDGETHELVIHIALQNSNTNNTISDKIDLNK